MYLGNCTLLYGAPGCRVSFLAVHIDSCNTNSLMGWVSDYADRYRLPLWITEWSCQAASFGRPLADHLSYMTAALPLLDASPLVFRYAWMAARSANRGLVQDVARGGTTLTALGEAYNNL